jgi:hypothetical protein
VPWAAGSWTTGSPQSPVAIAFQECEALLLEAAPPPVALPSAVWPNSPVRAGRATSAESSPSASACGLLLCSQQGNIKWPDGA